MPKQNIPSYRLHPATGQAIVVLNRRTIYLGKYKSKASREKYNQVIADYLANGKKLPPTRSSSEIRVEEGIIRFLEHAETFYTKKGRLTSSFSNHQESLGYLNRWYGDKYVSEFGPVSLQFLREKLLEEGYTKRNKETGEEYREDYARRTVNARTGCIVNFYRWLVVNELCPVEVWTALKAVPRLAKGRSKAKESEPVHPVASEIVEATLPYLSPVIADMIRVQLLTGARPGEICYMRPCDIDRDRPIWKFVPMEYKTDHLEQSERMIPVGPRAQAILQPYLGRQAETPDEFVFSPKETVRLKHEAKRRNRKCKVYESQERYRRKKQEAKSPKRPPKDHYTPDSYRQAIKRITEKHGLPHWTPHQLRHSAGTDIRDKFGLDAAQAVLGHSNAKTTEIYAELNFEKAARIAAEIG